MTGKVAPPRQALLDEAWDAVLLTLTRAAAQWSRSAFAKGVQDAEFELDRTGLHDPQAEEFVRAFPMRSIRSIHGQSREGVRLLILEAVRDGEGPDVLKRRIQDYMGSRAAVLATVARTETNRAANWARYSSWRKSGLVREKEVIVTVDDRVRDSHLLAHGERADLNAPFTRGAAAGLMMPPFEPNCRCTVAPITRFSDEPSAIIRDRDQAADDLARARGLSFAKAAVAVETPGLLTIERGFEAAMVTVWRDGLKRVVGLIQPLDR